VTRIVFLTPSPNLALAFDAKLHPSQSEWAAASNDSAICSLRQRALRIAMENEHVKTHLEKRTYFESRIYIEKIGDVLPKLKEATPVQGILPLYQGREALRQSGVNYTYQSSLWPKA